VNWFRLLGASAFMLLLTPSLLLLPSDARPFVVGAWLATTAWMLVFGTTVASGAATRIMGETGEQLTAGDLRKARRTGWLLVNHIRLGREEIDHVMVGPGGLVVAESKWTGWKQDLSDSDIYDDEAARLARRATMVAGTLRHIVGKCPVRRVVVVWGPEFERFAGSAQPLRP
jgi:hypothetical protein